MSERAKERLRLGLPKGSLQDTTVKLLSLAGYQIRVSERSYYPEVDDPELECILIRSQEIPRYVEQGVIDAGITGLDWVLETQAEVEELADLRAPWPSFGPVRWVLAVKAGSRLREVQDLEGKRIAAEVVGLTRRHLEQVGVKAEVEFSWGATEAKPPILADAIVDVTETGASLRANNLEVIDVLLESTPRFIANRAAYADRWKRTKIDRLLIMIRGAIAAASRVALSMNVPRESLGKVLELLPALDTPTVSPLADDRWVDVTTIVDEKRVRDLVPELSRAGARGIIEYPLNKVIA